MIGCDIIGEMASLGEASFTVTNVEACKVCPAGKGVCDQFGSAPENRVATVVGTRGVKFCEEAVKVLNERREELGLELIK